MSKSLTTVFVRNLEVLARIGVHGHEHGKPQPVRINVWLTCRTGAEGDKLESVVDYGKVADTIRAIVSSGHINLAETLAERIANTCLEDKRVEKARIRVEKLHALQGTESAGVEIERAK